MINTDHTQLTAREQQILILAGQGLTYAQIGARLGIKRGTVDSYASSIRDRLRAQGRLPWRLKLADIAEYIK